MKKMKKKGLFISLGIVLTVIVVAVILSFTLFSLQSVEIDYRTSRESITLTSEQIIEKSEIKKGGSVFFHSKKGYIRKIEEADPYIKVVNIETVFPSKFVIHIAERQKVFAVKGEEEYYICDENLRVLEIVSSIEGRGLILLKPEESITFGEIGKELSVRRKSEIYQALLENNRPLSQQRALIEKVELFQKYDNILKKDLPCTRVTLASGMNFEIVNDGYGLKYKVKMMLDIFSQYRNFVGKDCPVIGEDGKTTLKIFNSAEQLESCTFIISNFYDSTKYDEKQCYFVVQEPIAVHEEDLINS